MALNRRDTAYSPGFNKISKFIQDFAKGNTEQWGLVTLYLVYRNTLTESNIEYNNLI